MTDREFLVGILPHLPFQSYEMMHLDSAVEVCRVELPGNILLDASFDAAYPTNLIFHDRPCPVWAADPGLSGVVQERFLRRTVSYTKRHKNLLVDLLPVDIDDKIMAGIQLIEDWFRGKERRAKFRISDFDPMRCSIGEAATRYFEP